MPGHFLIVTSLILVPEVTVSDVHTTHVSRYNSMRLYKTILDKMYEALFQNLRTEKQVEGFARKLHVGVYV